MFSLRCAGMGGCSQDRRWLSFLWGLVYGSACARAHVVGTSCLCRQEADNQLVSPVHLGIICLINAGYGSATAFTFRSWLFSWLMLSSSESLIFLPDMIYFTVFFFHYHPPPPQNLNKLRSIQLLAPNSWTFAPFSVFHFPLRSIWLEPHAVPVSCWKRQGETLHRLGEE